MEKQEYLRPSAVAKMFGVSPATIYRWFWFGKLAGIKLDRTVRISQESCNKLMEQARDIYR